MNLLTNLDLFSVAFVTATILILAFAVFFNNRDSITNQAFLFFAIITVLWGWVNYSNYQVHVPYLAFWLTKLTLFFAVWHVYGIFQFFYVFPNEKVAFSRLYKFFILPITVITSLVVLTPFALVEVTQWSEDGRILQIINGPGMALFALVIFSFIISATTLLIKKFLSSKKNKKIQFILIFIGTVLTFILLLSFNFILPAFFAIPRFIPYGMVFIFPFILFTTYAIIRHGFLNLKVISTELLVFGLSTAIIFEIVISDSLITILYKISLFLLVLGVGILLIRSVRSEVQQREKVTKLAKSLENANVKLQELDQLKTEFLSIATHQLRTPLSIIKGYTSLMQDGAYGKMPKKAFPILDNIDVSNERLIKLVDEFLNVSRIEQGRTQYRFVDTPIKELAEGVVTELKQRALPKHITLDLAIGKGVKNADMDEDKIRHGLYNFVDNAIKYSPEKTSVHISIEEKDGGVAFHVMDEGVGMDEKDLKNLFQKFYRSEHVLRDFQGTGLGLFVVKQFTEAHHGKVWAKSKGIGKGSEFGMWIPVKQKTASAVQEKE